MQGSTGERTYRWAARLSVRFGALIIALITASWFTDGAAAQEPPQPPASAGRASTPSVSKVTFGGIGRNAQQVVTGLQQGWNLVSFQVLPLNPSPQVVLSGLSADPSLAVRSIWGFDSGTNRWLSWKPGDELTTVDGVTLPSIDYLRGYWLDLAQGGLTLTIDGVAAPSGSMGFGPGWNLVGFPGGTGGERSVAQIEAIFRQHVQGTDPDVDRVYTFDSTGAALRWDFTIDRREGDYNADGAVNSADAQFQIEFAVPDDIPELAESAPNPDTLATVMSGGGYWVHARRGFTLSPKLRVQIASDLDNAPEGNFPSPEDVDFDGDGLLDSGAWTSPDPITPETQSSIFIPETADTAQIVFSNPGTGVLNWSIEFLPSPTLAFLAPNAVTIEPAAGIVLTGTDSVLVSVDRTGLPPGEFLGTLNFQSNGGARTLSLVIEVPGLIGDFAGRATVERVNGKPVDLPFLDLYLSLFRTADGSIRGQLRNDESAHFPIPVSIEGMLLDPGSTSFLATGGYNMPPNAILTREPDTENYSIEQGPAGDEVFHVNTINPFPRPVYREFAFAGDRTINDTGVTGVFFDTLFGLTAEPVTIEGTFELNRVSLTPSMVPMAGSEEPCAIPIALDQVISDSAAEENYFALDGVTGCDPITNPVLIQDVAVYVNLVHHDRQQLRIRLLSPTENEADPNAGVLLFDGQLAGAPMMSSPDVSWPVQFSEANLVLFPQEGKTALADAYRGQRADQGNGQWRLGISDQVADDSRGRLTKWALSFSGPKVHRIIGRVVNAGTTTTLESAQVALTGGGSLFGAVTGPDGSFEFDLLPERRYRLDVQKAGFAFDGIEPPRPGDPLNIDLTQDIDIGDVQMLPLSVGDPTILIQPDHGRIGTMPGGAPEAFRGTLRYVAAPLIDGDTYQFILQRYDRDPAEPSPSDPAYVTGGLAPVPVGDPIFIPPVAQANPFAEFELLQAGIYSVTAVVFRGEAEVFRVGESDPKPLERFTIRVEDRLPNGGGIYLAGGSFAFGGVSALDGGGLQMTTATGATVTGRSAANSIAITGGSRLELLNPAGQ